MRAIVCHKHGDPSVMTLEDVADPVADRDQIVIRAEAIGVNFVDTMRRSGRHPAAPPTPFTPGIEVVGHVEQVGNNVNRFAVGDRVIGRCVTHGACAERVAVESRFAVACPDSIPANEAAGLFVNGQTAVHALQTMGQLQAGEDVLITAAAGGVGQCAIQISKALGGRVIALAGSKDKLALTEQLGADVSIDYSQQDWPEHVRDVTGGNGAMLILESVGGSIARGCLSAWAPGGRMVVFGNASGEPGIVDTSELLFGNRSVHGLAVGTVIEDENLMRAAMDRILGWYESGQLRIHVGETWPLEEAAEAHRRLESRATSGKIVLLP